MEEPGSQYEYAEDANKRPDDAVTCVYLENAGNGCRIHDVYGQNVYHRFDWFLAVHVSVETERQTVPAIHSYLFSTAQGH